MSDLTVNVNLDIPQGALHFNLQKTQQFVSAALHQVNQIDCSNTSLPTSGMENQFAELKWSNEEFQRYYVCWVVTNGFRDAIESFMSFLDSVNQIASWWEISKGPGQKIQISKVVLEKILDPINHDFHKKGFPDKLKWLGEKHGIALSTERENQLKSINESRNCYVHRNGIVSAKNDVGTDGKLVVRWSELNCVVNGDSGEREFVKGISVSKGDPVTIRRADKEKSFDIGASLEFSVEEISGICQAVFLYGVELMEKLMEKGRMMGFVKDVDKVDMEPLSGGEA